ncbi:ABC transporter substrate-binding protein [Huintestinicola sp.]|uniref:ABC transporter substrate-binding protein n=1 Tax=Huintestinicola sp. TaxID=2981661 RepID=UPI003D7CDFDE
MRNLIKLAGILLCTIVFCSCSKKAVTNGFSLENAEPVGEMELMYATQFSVEYYENDISLVTVSDGEKYLLVPENEAVEEIPNNITLIRTPADNIYLAASSAMDMFFGIGAEGNVRATATLERDWALSEVKEAMANEDILYAGKYSAPDYELILSEGCGLAIESTMIYHKPEVKEHLQRLGIPVLIERSSYETHPLGRLEWVKLYGLLTGREEEAERLFSEQSELLNSITQSGSTGKTAAFFYISSNGYAVVRKPGDYVSRMIELGGGEYIFSPEELNVDENAQSTINMQFEVFYSEAAMADVLIYNSTIDGGMDNLSQLTEKNSLLSEFKAVRSGDVWCTDKNMFQQTTGAAEVIRELNLIFTGEAEDDMEYFYRLK